MKLLKQIRKQGGAITAITRVVMAALMISLVFSPLAFSANAATAVVNACCSKNADEAMTGGHRCCSMPECCSMKKNEGSRAPQQPCTSLAASAQQDLNALPPIDLPLLKELSFVKAPVRVSREEVPHRSTTPLAQGCICLI